MVFWHQLGTRIKYWWFLIYRLPVRLVHFINTSLLRCVFFPGSLNWAKMGTRFRFSPCSERLHPTEAVWKRERNWRQGNRPLRM